MQLFLPAIIGDFAFPLQYWIMKPYTNVVVTKKQTNLNYCLSRASERKVEGLVKENGK